MAELNTKDREKLRSTQFAYVDSKGEEHLPINDESHVRNAIARFNQVKNITDNERDEAWKRIKSAAKKFGVEMKEEN